MKRPALAALACLIGALLSGPAALAQASGRGSANVPTVTLYVKTFATLEQRLAEAQNQRDAQVLAPMLSPFFEARGNDGSRLTREQWLQRAIAGGGPALGGFSQLAVYETGQHAVANFRQRDASGAERLIVDVWAPSETGGWELRVRFESPAAPIR